MVDFVALVGTAETLIMHQIDELIAKIKVELDKRGYKYKN